MNSGVKRRASARLRNWRVRIRVLAVMAAALGCAACTAAGPDNPGLTLAAAPAGSPVVAFESIDGPPKSVYGKLVNDLTKEAKAHRIAVVSRRGSAHYRVRIYAAPVATRKRSALYWVWDVYDARRQRAFRIAGEEPIRTTGRASWASTNDKVIRKVTRIGMARLANYLHPPVQDAAPPAPSPVAGRALAMAVEN